MTSVTFTTLIRSEELMSRCQDPDWAIVDCRFSLSDPAYGPAMYESAHIPGAVYADVERDLSGPIIAGRTGRHPLPAPDVAEATFGRLGIGAGVQVVAYDDCGGCFAARLWWLLRYFGHDAVAVLDGGWPAWLAAGGAIETGANTRAPRAFRAKPREEWVVAAHEVERTIGEPGSVLLDARAAERYRGENETIDPVAGRIPGAVSAPYAANLDRQGRFLQADELRARYDRLLGDTPPEGATVYCGSGVTAAHDLLAMAVAGLSGAKLYAGSWSDWITDPARPVQTGP
jgi:thiosulfate/3-mercaptopyruvate sulfurtransferase